MAQMSPNMIVNIVNPDSAQSILVVVGDKARVAEGLLSLASIFA